MNKTSQSRKRLKNPVQPGRLPAIEGVPSLAQRVESTVHRARREYAGRNLEAAASLYKQTLLENPNDPVLMLELAQTLALLHRRAAAVRLLKKAVEATPQRAEIQGVAGQLFEQMRLHDDAGACFQRALRANPRSIAAANCLAQAAERSHRIEDAREFVDRTLSMNPSDPQARLTQAILDRREGEWESAVVRLRVLIGRDPPAPISWQARYQLAHVLDRLGEYDSAMQELSSAKAILKVDAQEYRQKADVIEHRLRQTAEGMIPAYSLDWQRENIEESGRRHAVLMGHPRSGTTLLEQALDAHPDVVSAEELPILAELIHDPIVVKRDPDALVQDTLDRLSTDDLTEYRRVYFEAIDEALLEPIGDRLLIDKNPEALRLAPTLCRVFPTSKLIVAVRDPRDVCLSCFMQPLPLNSVSVSFLDLATTVERYANVMSFWLRVRRAINLRWIEIRYEDVVSDLALQTRRASKFLDLPWDERMTRTEQHARSRYVHSPSYEAVTSGVHGESVGRWRNYSKYFEPLLEQLEPFLTEWNYE